MHKVKPFFKKYSLEIFLFSIFLLLSNMLAWKTFRLTPQGDMQIATKAWSDFAATIPLIRSFSYGTNFPPQYPIFAGPPIRYHFIFFALVGLLEKVGIPLDWALNSLSSLGFFLLFVAIYTIGKVVFKSKTVGVISTLLFPFNGSFGFVEFFKKHPLSLSTPTDIITNIDFSSFGPYDGKIVSAFWNLNIYTNQRHLALAYAIFLLLVLLIYKFSQHPKKLTLNKTLLIGILIGLFPFIHMAVFGMMGITLLIHLVIYSKLRRQILLIGVVALYLAIPQIIYMGYPQIKTSLINPGYLIENLNLTNFVTYWVHNLGLTIVLAPLGFVLANKRQRSLFLPFIIFFIIGNIFQFTPSMIDNHKFFNLFSIGGILLAAFFLYKLFTKNVAGKILAFSITPLLIITGVIDIFPIINDKYMTVKDIANNNAAKFIIDNTSKDSVFLNSNYLYDPASLAGRKIFLGWPYFPWSIGYDNDTRLKNFQKVLNSNDKDFVCNFLLSREVNYMEIQNPPAIENVEIDYKFFENNFVEIYKEGEFAIYDVARSCKNRES